MNIKRVMIAAPKSGSGKTGITCALLKSLKNKRIKTVSFKCGPDYIDPMYYTNQGMYRIMEHKIVFSFQWNT